MAKKDSTFTIYDDEPNPFAMSEEEYAIARDEYYKKIAAEHAKIEEQRKYQTKKQDA